MNLVTKGIVYYHNQLRIMPSAPVCVFDDDGNAVWTQEKFYLKYKTEYSEEDLLHYFVKMTGHNLIDKKRQLAGLQHLVGEYGVDLVLFAIDQLEEAIVNGRKTPKLTLEIKDYIYEASEAMDMKKALDRENGIVNDRSKNVPF